MSEKPQANGKYLYAIIACSDQHEFICKGIGERGDPVNTICYRRLAAVVSDSPIIKYENSRRNMMAHTFVLEEIMTEFELLPVRFGTVAISVEAIEKKILEARYNEFTLLLEQNHNKIELGLKAFWHEGAIFEEVAKENEKIRRLKALLKGRSLEETYYERIKLGEEVERTLKQMRIRDEENILFRLHQFVDKTRINKVLTDRMVLNAAFLVDSINAVNMDNAVKKLDEEFGKRMMFKYVGPVPPYNFVNISINLDD
jgi:hypothetical protein